jgi:aryl-alcohol dehydrogenase
MAARIVGATTIIGIDMKPARLQLARELGATHTINASETGASEEIARITGSGVDFALETTGSPSVFRTAVEATVPTGETGIVGAPAFGTEVALDVNSILVTGRRIRGIVEGDSVPRLFIPDLIELWRQGSFPVERIIRTYDFDQIELAVGDAESGDAVKPVLVM